MKIMHSMYTYLWVKKDSREPNKFSFKLPNTILIQNGSFTKWYFSNKEFKLKQKVDASMSLEEMVRVFKRSKG